MGVVHAPAIPALRQQRQAGPCGSLATWSGLMDKLQITAAVGVRQGQGWLGEQAESPGGCSSCKQDRECLQLKFLPQIFDPSSCLHSVSYHFCGEGRKRFMQVHSHSLQLTFLPSALWRHVSTYHKKTKVLSLLPITRLTELSGRISKPGCSHWCLVGPQRRQPDSTHCS